MPSASETRLDTPFAIGEWRVEPDTLRLQRGDEAVKLEPKVMEVLLCLAREAGKVVSRQQIEATVWPGVVVCYDSLGSTIIKLRKAFNDDPRNPAVIETVSKKGYRLLLTPGLLPAEQPLGTRATAEPKMSSWKRPVFFLLAGIAAIAVAVASYFQFVSGTRTHPVPTLAVLPFKNLSNDPSQEYFSDGITSDLITDLSNLSGIEVIAWSSVFPYKNADPDLRQLREDLGVDYIVEGSVRKSGTTLRVSARLVNAGDGVSVWADRFDADFSDVFKIQDETTAKIISALQVKVTDKEKQRIAQVFTDSIEAYDEFLKGWTHFWRYTRDDNRQARNYYRKAVELDDNFARAYANLAVTYSFDYLNGWSEDPQASLAKAHAYTEKALALDDSLPQVQWASGIVNTYSRNYEVAITAAEKAIANAPNFADGYGLLATVLNYAAQPKKAEQAMHKAMRLNPRHPFIYQMILGQIYFNLYEYEKAELLFTSALDRNPTAQEVRLWLTATYANMGRIEDASWELEQIRIGGGELTVASVEKTFPIKDPALRKHLLDGLIKAGLN